MKQYIKSYHIFFPRKWVTWCTYLLYPFFVIGWCYYLFYFLPLLSSLWLGFACCMIGMIEIMLDTYMFLGIAAKGNDSLEYFKTSAKGLSVLQKALVMDAVRRFFSIALILAGIFLLDKVYGGEDGSFLFLQYLLCVFILFLLPELGFLFTRFSSNVIINLAVVYLVGAMAWVVGSTVPDFSKPLLPMIVSLAAGILTAVMGRMRIMKRERESYYDS